MKIGSENKRGLTLVLLWAFIGLGIAVLNACMVEIKKPPLFCENAKPIYLSKADKISVQTADSIIRHNEFGEKHCDWKRAK